MILPCSGIGKAYCLLLLTLDDEQAQERVRNAPVITIDACLFKRVQVNVEHAGGTNAAVVRVLDVSRMRKELKVHSVSELGANGETMAQILADENAANVDELYADGGFRC